MMFFSTRNQQLRVSLEKAVIDGLAEDGGLFLPEKIVSFSSEQIQKLCAGDFRSIAFAVAAQLLQDSLDPSTLKDLVEKAFPFDAKTVPLEENFAVVELFHGPTLAFKDFGARFLAQLLGHFAKRQEREITVLVATSGDTGSAVAAGFFRTPGVRVALLYPQGRVSPLQEKQLTSFAENIHAFEVAGNFDDCQALVKTAFNDNDLKQRMNLTSANSINIARLIPQSFYYFSAFAALNCPTEISFAVPSGNFGNLTAGVLAKRLGLPIRHLIAGTNANDTVPRYLESGLYEPMKSVHTISNAMDVGNPSNIERLNALHHGAIEDLRRTMTSCRFDDQQTRALMAELYQRYNYVAEPHTAIAFGAAKQLDNSGSECPRVFLSTAHPIKFSEEIEKTLHISVPLPSHLEELMKKEKHAQKLGTQYDEFKAALIKL